MNSTAVRSEQKKNANDKCHTSGAWHSGLDFFDGNPVTQGWQIPTTHDKFIKNKPKYESCHPQVTKVTINLF